MSADPRHRWQVFSAPWPGVHGVCIDTARHYARHWHDAFCVGLVEHGAQTSVSGRGQVDAYAGDLITCNPGEVHDGRPLGGTCRRWRLLAIEPSGMAAVSFSPARGGRATFEITQPVIRDVEMRAAFLTLLGRIDRWQQAHTGRDALRLACDEALVDTMALMATRYTATPPEEGAEGQIKHVRDRLADETSESPTLACLAAMTGMSQYQLVRRFKAVYGMPPHAWLLQLRAERARWLICNGAALAQAAATCGFADQSHISRIFMRKFGFTPGAWRRATTQGTSSDKHELPQHHLDSLRRPQSADSLQEHHSRRATAAAHSRARWLKSRHVPVLFAPDAG